MTTVFREIPYRRWGDNTSRWAGKLIDCKEGKRVMSLMFAAMKSGQRVEFTQHPPMFDGTDERGRKIPHISGIYDTISLTITDTP